MRVMTMAINTMVVLITMKNTMTTELAPVLLMLKTRRISQLATKSAVIVESVLTEVEQINSGHVAREEADLHKQ